MGTFDSSAFNELEFRCYTLIASQWVSMTELETVYTLDEMLKLYSIYRMRQDIEAGQSEEMKAKMER